MTTTTNLGLSVYDIASGSEITFQSWRLALAGNTSNMSIIDTFAGETSSSIVVAKAASIIYVAASYISTNYFEASTTAVTSYVTNMLINLKLNATITGATTININALGNVVLKKVDVAGNLVDLASGDLKINSYYVFIYNGTYFILVTGGLTAVSGTANNLLMISSGGSIVDSGIPYTYTVTNGNTHDHLGGDGAQIAHTSLSGSGTNTHATIDLHIANLSNPHSTTASQISAATTSGSNAFIAENSFRGISLGYGSGSVSSNTILGVDSLSVNTTGSRCVAMGYHALKANTDGNNNTALGFSALKANQGGDYNVAIGSDTLLVNTTGNSNIAIGDVALDANIGGSSNIAIGDTSLSANTSGGGNTAVGDNSLAANTGGDENTGVGKAALGSNTNGDFNTAIGDYAGYSITTGSYNVFLGAHSGYTASQNGSAVNSVAIGYKAYTTLNDTVVIGGSAIVGVGIAKVNPAFMLDVNGSVNIPTGSTYNINGSPVGGISATKTFYSASASGGVVETLNTVIILNGLITSWTQA